MLNLTDSRLKRALGYPRFADDTCRVLVLDGGYHLHRECQAALRRLGCEVVSIKVSGPASAIVRELLLALVERRPDLILSINQIGFDEEGVLGGVLEALEVPIAVWYVDSPLFILRGAPFPAPRVSTVFLWERTLIPTLRALGVEDLHYLPLATDPAVFAPAESPREEGLCFLGDSMEHARKKWSQRLGRRGKASAAALRARLLRGERLDALLAEPTVHPSGENPWDIIAHGTYTATAEYRLEILRAVAGPELQLFGDEGWRRILPQASWRGPVEYGEPAAAIYAASTITLNATSFQMPTAVNQRVFDVPAAGGFLLSDAREDLAELFDLGREVIAFHGPAELAELVRYYRSHAAERRAITGRARARVLAEHTYDHRLARMLELLRARHRRRPSALAAMAQPCGPGEA